LLLRNSLPQNWKKGWIFLGCEPSETNKIHSSVEIHGKYKSNQQQLRRTNNKKCSCLFLLKGKQLSYEEGWVLSVDYCVHNHLAAKHLEEHSFAGRLSEEEDKLVVDISKTLVRPRDILNTLKQRSSLNVNTLRTINNARKKFKS